jgi:hypothetical protein
MNLVLKLGHFDFNELASFARSADHRGNWERIDIAVEFDATTYRNRRGHDLIECR